MFDDLRVRHQFFRKSWTYLWRSLITSEGGGGGIFTENPRRFTKIFENWEKLRPLLNSIHFLWCVSDGYEFTDRSSCWNFHLEEITVYSRECYLVRAESTEFWCLLINTWCCCLMDSSCCWWRSNLIRSGYIDASCRKGQLRYRLDKFGRHATLPLLRDS